MAIENFNDDIGMDVGKEAEKQQLMSEIEELNKQIEIKSTELETKKEELKLVNEFQTQFHEQFSQCSKGLDNIGGMFSNISYESSSSDSLLSGIGTINSDTSTFIADSLTEMSEKAINLEVKTKNKIEQLTKENLALEKEISRLKRDRDSKQQQLNAL